MNRYFSKLFALVRLYQADVFAYKASAFIWVLGDLQVALMMPIVWRAVGGLSGFSVAEVTSYYLVMMTISQFVTCHLLWDIGFDIREGTFSGQILRPFSHLSMSFARNIAWRVGKLVLFLPFLLLLLPIYGFEHLVAGRVDGSFLLALMLGQTLAFFAAYCIAMVAMWTTEFVSLFQLYYVPELIFSGRVVPLTALPEWAQAIGRASHFRYTVAFPTEVYLGRLTQAEVMAGFGAQVGWGVFFYALSLFLFQRGVKQYSGFGM